MIPSRWALKCSGVFANLVLFERLSKIFLINCSTSNDSGAFWSIWTDLWMDLSGTLCGCSLLKTSEIPNALECRWCRTCAGKQCIWPNATRVRYPTEIFPFEERSLARKHDNRSNSLIRTFAIALRFVYYRVWNSYYKACGHLELWNPPMFGGRNAVKVNSWVEHTSQKRTGSNVVWFNFGLIFKKWYL